MAKATKFFYCSTCDNQLGYCTCSKLYRVVSGSHNIHVQWGLGCFWATSADVASMVTESEKQYLATWPRCGLSFEPVEPEYDGRELDDHTCSTSAPRKLHQMDYGHVERKARREDGPEADFWKGMNRRIK